MYKYIKTENDISEVEILPAHSWSVEEFLNFIGKPLSVIASSDGLYEDVSMGVSGKSNSCVQKIWTINKFEKYYHSLNEKSQIELDDILVKLITCDIPLNSKGIHKPHHLKDSNYCDIHLDGGNFVLIYTYLKNVESLNSELILDLSDVVNHKEINRVTKSLDKAYKNKKRARNNSENQYELSVSDERVVQIILNRRLDAIIKQFDSDDILTVSIQPNVGIYRDYSEEVHISNLSDFLFKTYKKYKKSLISDDELIINIIIKSEDDKIQKTLSFPSDITIRHKSS